MATDREETNYEGGEEDFMIMFEETEILSLSLSTIHILIDIQYPTTILKFH